MQGLVKVDKENAWTEDRQHPLYYLVHVAKVALPLYPQLEDMRLVDYKVRILTPQSGTAAVTRVMIESADKNGRRWTTVGVSPNIIDASFNALHDGITWKLMQEGAEVAGTSA